MDQWARENSASLRSLAGQISVVDAHVRHALANDDPAALLQPLIQAQEPLRVTHPDLVQQIAKVTEHTDQIRRTTQSRRARTC